jgi:hypothetical protein
VAVASALRMGALLGALVSTGSPARAFNVGPFELGMSQQAAAKYGLSDCVEGGGKIRCFAYASEAAKANPMEIHFDKKTKRIERIELQFDLDESVQAEAQIASELQFAGCPAGMAQGSTCYAQPNQMREIRYLPERARRRYYRNGAYQVLVTNSSPMAVRFFAQKSKLQVAAFKATANGTATDRLTAH